MFSLNQLANRVPFLTNGEALLGLVFLLTGGLVARDGIIRLIALWTEFRPYFPFTLPEDTAEKTLSSFPFIFGTFITVVASICAVLIGLLWVISGIEELYHSRKKQAEFSDLDRPEAAAESLRHGDSLEWRSDAWLVRIWVRLWPRTRFVSAVSRQIFRDVVRSVVKLFLLGLLVALIFSFLHVIPGLVRRYLHVTANLTVPSARPLYVLLGLLLAINVVIALTLLPYRRKAFLRTRLAVPVRGTGDPHFFFALIEEGCRLLSTDATSHKPPVRLESTENPSVKATLIEARPVPVPAFCRPIGYVCLPMIWLLVTMGFSRLTHFQGVAVAMPYQRFLEFLLLDYALDVAFGLGMIFSGIYVAEWARELFSIRRFESTLVLCSATSTTDSPISVEKPAAPGAADGSARTAWKGTETVDDHFAAWARGPCAATRFSVEACWADIISESAEPGAPRHLIGMQTSKPLGDAMNRILDLPFHIRFATDGEAGTPES